MKKLIGQQVHWFKESQTYIEEQDLRAPWAILTLVVWLLLTLPWIISAFLEEGKKCPWADGTLLSSLWSILPIYLLIFRANYIQKAAQFFKVCEDEYKSN